MLKRVMQTLTVVLALAASVYAAAPQMINYQGRLTDAAGNPVADGMYSVVFNIYDAATAGTSVWTETQNVTTADGLFAVLLGSVTPITDAVFNGTTRYLGIAVAGDPELSPRVALVSVPYAHRVNTVDGASGGNITSKVSIGPGVTNSGLNAFAVGQNNAASGENSTIGGGTQNIASHTYSTVGGGRNNIASNLFATIGGGDGNTASSGSAVVGGGTGNIASEALSTVGGGGGNNANGNSATIGGGSFNEASNSYATVPGGNSNTAGGTYSFAAGRRAKANHNGTFVWADTYMGSESNSGEEERHGARCNGRRRPVASGAAGILGRSMGGATITERLARAESEEESAMLHDLPLDNPRILDLGCATGWMTSWLSELGHAEGVDLSEAAIAMAKSKYPGIQFTAGNLYEIPLTSEPVDLVVCQEVIAHVSDQPLLIKRIAEVIKPGGYLIISAANKFVMDRMRDDDGVVGVGSEDPAEHIKKWLDMKGLKRLLEADFSVIQSTSVIPMGNRGLLRIINSAKLNKAIGWLISERRLEALKEWMGVGYSIVVIGKRKS